MHFLKKIFGGLNEKGVVHLIPLFLLLIGIIAGVYLVQKEGFQLFQPKAASKAVEFSAASGQDTAGTNCRVYEENGTQKTNCPKVNLKFTSPLEVDR